MPPPSRPSTTNEVHFHSSGIWHHPIISLLEMHFTCLVWECRDKCTHPNEDCEVVAIGPIMASMSDLYLPEISIAPLAPSANTLNESTISHLAASLNTLIDDFSSNPTQTSTVTEPSTISQVVNIPSLAPTIETVIALDYFKSYPDLASIPNGGKVLFATDDFFAVCESMISNQPVLWDELKYTEHGKWMDGLINLLKATNYN